MSRLLSFMLLGTVACATALAQQKKDPTKSPAETAPRPTEAATTSQPQSQQIVSPDALSVSLSTIRLVVPEVKFVVRDGAVYISFSESGPILPMPGGGASGCFTLELPARIERLKQLVPTLPVY